MTVKKDFPYGDHCAIIIQIDGKSKKTDKGEILMKHVKTLNTRKLQNTIKTGGCGECQTSPVKNVVSRWQKKGWIKKMTKDQFQKLKDIKP